MGGAQMSTYLVGQGLSAHPFGYSASVVRPVLSSRSGRPRAAAKALLFAFRLSATLLRQQSGCSYAGARDLVPQNLEDSRSGKYRAPRAFSRRNH